ncbi:MAG: ribosome biogenesis GTPase Der, partial [Nitrospirae bacterium]|nr:ribosome biogenesis GTPase Der [Nitrospirota bacterium]
MMPNNPLVAIVGRPNVGKSTLFNRIIGERKSIVEAEPGVTRDRVYAEGEWRGKKFSLVDTGGLVPGVSGGILSLVKKQVKVAMEETDVLLFLVDVRAGITSLDEEIGKWLRKINKPIILAANKADSSQAGEGISDFYRLGLSSPVAVSAMHGLNINYLLDKICEVLPLEGKGVREEGVKVAVVGRPNVGKSSFINALLQEERLIVDKKPGTTRDAIDTAFHLGEEKFVFVDTAG